MISDIIRDVWAAILNELRQETKITEDEKKKAKSLAVFLLGAILILGTVVPLHVYSTVTLGNEVNLSNTPSVISSNPKIVASGSNVYVVWQEGATTSQGIFFNASSDSGSTFLSSGTIKLSSGTDDSDQAQITANGTKVYVVWRNDATDNDIFFKRSTDGSTFSDSTIDLSGDGTDAQNPHIATVGDNVYVVWENKTSTSPTNFDVVLRKSTTSGSAGSFTPTLTVNATNISADGKTSTASQIAATGTNVYVVWVNDTSSNAEIYLGSSTDSGATFPTITRISDDSINSKAPQVAASGNNVFVVWRNDTSPDNIGYAKSSDNGATFTTPINLSNTTGTFASDVQIVAIDSNVYVTWRDSSPGNNDILFTKSTDNGATFSTVINLSANSGSSILPKLNATGTNVYVTWKDNTSGDFDILLKSSVNNGKSFCGNPTNLSNNGGDSEKQQIASAGSKVYVTWQDDTDVSSNTDEVLFNVGTVSTTCFQFDETEYRVSETATLNVTSASSNTDSDSKETINVNVKSDTFAAGITLTLTETAKDSAVFEGTMTFSTSETSGSTLKVSTGDTITATLGSQTGTASIFAVTFDYDTTTPTLSLILNFSITDQNSNTDTSTAETISVNVKSDTDTTGISLQLNETGVNTGKFAPKSLVFMTGNDLVPFTSTMTIQLVESGSTFQNVNDDAVDKISMFFNSTSDQGGLTIILTETGVNTGIFKNTTSFTSGTSSGTALKAAPGDIFGLTFEGETSHGLVTPNGDPSLGALQTAIADTITVTHGGDSDSSVTITKGSGGGGGGGGLVRPSLVLDIVASASAGVFGGGGRGAAPILNLKALSQSSFIDMPDEIDQVIMNFHPFTPLEPFDVNAEQFETFDFPFSIDNDGYALSGYSNTLDTKTLNTGEATKIKTVFYMPFELEHVAFYTNIREGDSLDDSDAFLRFYTSKPDLNQIKDENGFFEYITLTIEEDGIKKTATFDIKFKNPMPKSDIVLRMWDKDLHSTTVLIFDAIEVVGPSIEPIEEPAPEGLEIPEPGTTIPETSELRIEESLTAVPDWIKTSARWWNNEQITDTGFARGIEYLIENNILKVPQTETFEQEQVQEIPGWIKNTAGWWGNGLLPDQDFVNGIQWLIENGIIKIQINS